MTKQSDTGMINPEALRAARKRRKMTQEVLARTLKCSKDTVSRWERGTSKRVRPRLQKALCDTLRVDWNKLTRPPGQPENTFHDLFWTKVSIRKTLRTSVLLAAKRYGVSSHDVLDLAPLLFVIAAERSLLARRKRLDAINAVTAEAEQKLHDNCGHLGGIIAARSMGAEDQLNEEEKSLDNRDVFGKTITYEHWNEGDEGPFIHFVRGLVKDLPEGAVSYIHSFDGDMIDDYTIADDTFADCTGLSGEQEQDSRYIHYIRRGMIDLNECMRIRRERAEDSYRQWLSDESKQAADQNELLKSELFGFGEDKADTPGPETRQ